MKKEISIIMEDGVAIFQKIDISTLQDELNHLLLIKTDDDKEHLGIFYSYDSKWDSVNLKSAHREILSYVKKERIKEVYKKI
jgi:hypothetical protein